MPGGLPYEIIRTEKQPKWWAALGAAPVSAQTSLVLVKHQTSEPSEDHGAAQNSAEPITPTAATSHPLPWALMDADTAVLELLHPEDEWHLA